MQEAEGMYTMTVDGTVRRLHRVRVVDHLSSPRFDAPVTVPRQAMWFVDAARRPVLLHPRTAGPLQFDRRTVTVFVPPASAAPLRRLAKRVLDVSVAATLLVILLPVLLGVALAVATTSRGGVLFFQKRVGVDGALFPMIKFRSMVADADSRVAALIDANESSGPLFKLRRDPRVTRVGRFLRRASLDELPQLLNVVLGHMSLVGPRPALPREVAQYSQREARRLQVKPGITGLWQVSGRSDLSWEDGVRLDLLYVDHWTLRADAKILARTVTTLIRSQGAY